MFNAFPGIALDENTTVSPGIILTYLCEPSAILDKAAKASPCDPVQTIHSFSGGIVLIILVRLALPCSCLIQPMLKLMVSLSLKDRLPAQSTTS